METMSILEQSLLRALEHAAPMGWSSLTVPQRCDPRAASAVLLRLAEAPDRLEMASRLRGIADRVEARRVEARKRDHASRPESLWKDLRQAIEKLGEGGDEGLFGLSLWRGLPLQAWVEPMRGLIPRQPPLRPGFLTAAARVLLRARARAWAEAARDADAVRRMEGAR